MTRMVGLLVAGLLLSTSMTAHGEGWACWAQASRRYGVPVTLLYSVARIESGANAHAIGGNLDGSHDIGLMQINSWWLPKLAKYGITERKLLSDPCLNLQVGAWILANSIRDHGFNWRGLGAYNARTDSKRAVYAARVIRELKKVRAEGYTDQVADAGQGAAP